MSPDETGGEETLNMAPEDSARKSTESSDWKQDDGGSQPMEDDGPKTNRAVPADDEDY